MLQMDGAQRKADWRDCISKFVPLEEPLGQIPEAVLRHNNGKIPVHIDPTLFMALTKTEREEIAAWVTSWCNPQPGDPSSYPHLGAGGLGQRTLASGRELLYVDDYQPNGTGKGFCFWSKT